MKLTIESEWGFEYFFHFEAHDKKVDFCLSQNSGCWAVSCYEDQHFYQNVGGCRIAAPEAIKRSLVYAEQYLKTKGG